MLSNIKHFLQYKIIDLEQFSLTPYHILLVLLIIAMTKTVLWIVKKFIYRNELKEKIGPGKQYGFYQIIKYVFIVIAIGVILESIGVRITFLLAGSAALLVGLGLGLQHTFNDVVSGIILLFEGTIKVGDVIETEGLVGKVKEIGLRTSVIETRDEITMIIPNSKFTGEKVTNWSHNMQPTRFGIAVGVAYSSDVELVQKLLLEAAAEHSAVVKSPEPRVRFRDFGDSSLNFELLVYSEDIFRSGRLKSDIRFIIDRKFRENGIQIPFPQRDVHLYTQK